MKLVVCLIALLLFAGCQWLPIQQGEAPVAIPVTHVSLLGWQGAPSDDERFHKAIDSFMLANPTISVTVELVSNYDERVDRLLEGETVPDVLFVDSGRFADLVAAQVLQPIGDRIEASGDFYPVLRETFTLSNTFYCPPRHFSTLALLYNKAMFDEKGLAYPSAAWTWQEFANNVVQMSDANTAVIGLSLPPDLSRWLPILDAYGGSLTDEGVTQMTINSPEAATAFHLLDDLWTNFNALQPSAMRTTWSGEAFGKQRVAMIIEGEWVVDYMQQEYSDIQIGITELPSGPVGKSTVAFSSCLALAVNASQPAAAIQLINYLVNAETMRSLNTDTSPIPARMSVGTEWVARFPQMQSFVEGVSYARPWRFFSGFESLKSTMEGDLQRMYEAKIAVEDLLLDAEEAGNRVVDKSE